MPHLLDAPKILPTNTKLLYAEPHILDLSLYKEENGRSKLLQVIGEAAKTGFIHIINHGLKPEWFQTVRDITYTYMLETGNEQKDRDSSSSGTGYFEGYKPRSQEEKAENSLPPIEEYSYDYFATGKVRRPPLIAENEDNIHNIFDFYHNTLTPILLDLINEYCQFKPGTLADHHSDTSEVAHLLFYRRRWFDNIKKKRGSYAGHTDIGTLTYLYANPSAGLQIYGEQGWRYVAYIPDSVVVNAGDALEYLTAGKINATLHRVLKPPDDQERQMRTAIVYFIHPKDICMRDSLAHYNAIQQKQTESSRKDPGSPINGACLNRLISAISANNSDEYKRIVDPQALNAAKSGGLISGPQNLMVDYKTLALLQIVPRNG
ncbi:hypothetical protein Egran_05321 [Elaphomyces granulatus]|uniref:Fe2OG dioxygenase domain-containing protein n=1 Tax=Elaphomyces granulatus TaxID=519963 RepID=A0A232LRX4_9EURO|nr:hypothetical protein Egran_05321 [Elaphomyces granulatus]